MIAFDSEEWTESHCTCLGYFKEFICVHIIYLAIKLNKTKLNTKFLNIGEKPKRGQKRKIGPALSFN